MLSGWPPVGNATINSFPYSVGMCQPTVHGHRHYWVGTSIAGSSHAKRLHRHYTGDRHYSTGTIGSICFFSYLWERPLAFPHEGERRPRLTTAPRRVPAAPTSCLPSPFPLPGVMRLLLVMGMVSGDLRLRRHCHWYRHCPC